MIFEAYHAKRQRQSSQCEGDRYKEDAKDGSAPSARCSRAREVTFTKKVIEALVDGPGNAAQQELPFPQLAAEVHVRKQQTLPVSVLFFGDVILKIEYEDSKSDI